MRSNVQCRLLRASMGLSREDNIPELSVWDRPRLSSTDSDSHQKITVAIDRDTLHEAVNLTMVKDGFRRH